MHGIYSVPDVLVSLKRLLKHLYLGYLGHRIWAYEEACHTSHTAY
jgi:hypothetical protein